ncbi:MAG: 23S rRNA (uracil(1939)-C(5))-methyltransferase RlmD [Bacillota bacterium]
MNETNDRKEIGTEPIKSQPPCSPGEICDLKIIDLNHRGEGVGRLSGFTVFVPGALPGETVRAKVTRSRKKYAEASLNELSSLSRERITPLCPYFEICGGCQLQHLQYKEQLTWKQKVVSETISRIAGLSTNVLPAIGMREPWHYRNKTRVHFAYAEGKVLTGFYKPQTNELIDIDQCPVQHPVSVRVINSLRKAVQRYMDKVKKRKGNWLPISEATIRTSFANRECLVSLSANPGRGKSGKNQGIKPENYEKLAQFINKESENILTGLVLLQHDKKGTTSRTLSGEAHITEEIKPYLYRISPQSFFQVNTCQAEVLYKKAVSLAGSPHTAYDLYCGTGNFSLYLSSMAGRVVGIDSAKTAIEDARNNATSNSTDNVEFVVEKAENIGPDLFKGEKPLTVFLNPPRKGCAASLLDAVSEVAPKRIVYISCNPATLARDLKQLSNYGYVVKEVHPIDMFPQTSHVESVCLLEVQGDGGIVLEK